MLHLPPTRVCHIRDVPREDATVSLDAGAPGGFPGCAPGGLSRGETVRQPGSRPAWRFLCRAALLVASNASSTYSSVRRYCALVYHITTKLPARLAATAANYPCCRPGDATITAGTRSSANSTVSEPVSLSPLATPAYRTYVLKTTIHGEVAPVKRGPEICQGRRKILRYCARGGLSAAQSACAD